MTQSSAREAREALLEDGFCIVDGRLPPGKIDFLSNWSDEWLASMNKPDRWKYQGSDIHLIGHRNPAKRYQQYPKDETIDFLIEHPAPILEELGLGDFKSGGAFQIISKPPNSPSLYWHQDWARWDDPLSMSPWPQQVFLNWYLSDTTTENGCLRVIPGSHRKRVDPARASHPSARGRWIRSRRNQRVDVLRPSVGSRCSDSDWSASRRGRSSAPRNLPEQHFGAPHRTARLVLSNVQ